MHLAPARFARPLLAALVLSASLWPAATFADQADAPEAATIQIADTSVTSVDASSAIDPSSALGASSAVDPSAIDPSAVDPSAIDPSSAVDVAPTPAPTAAATPAPVDTLVADHQYGMSLFIWDHPETTTRDLGVVNQAGFQWQKTLFEWSKIEGQCKGCFNWSEADRVAKATTAAGIKLLVRIDYEPDWARADHAHNGRPDNLQDYADFVRAVADRYKPGSPYGTVSAIEVWNEPNLQREWGEPISPQSAANYVQMLKLAYPAIKSVSPSTLVVTAGLSPTGWSDDTARPDDQFLQWMFDAGLSGNYDVLGLHGNSQVSDPTAAPGSVPGLADGSFYFRRVEQLRQIQVINGDGNKPVWLLEFGWTADTLHSEYSWFAVSEQQKAQNLLSAFQYARANWPWLGTMFVWTLPDPSWTKDREEYWWAIANPDGTPRPALTAILATAQAKQLPT